MHHTLFLHYLHSHLLFTRSNMSRWATFLLILSSSALVPPGDVCFLLFSSPSTPMTASPTAHQSNSSSLLLTSLWLDLSPTEMRPHTERRSAVW
ncbi:hypothetical protein LDENG_00230680 [Lucifuga dentata]|nr:hypothetical protein LDENG_00230680 [Lucifuga dentata]